MDKEEITAFLKTISLFDDFSERELTLLLPFTHTAVYKKGAFIMKEGEEGGSLSLIKNGKVEILKEDPESPAQFPLAELGPGEWVGEMALFENLKRSASVRALEDTEVVFLSLIDLYHHSDEQIDYSKVTLHLAKKISNRLKMTNEKTVNYLKQQLKVTQIHDHIARLIIYLVFLLLLLFVTFKMFNDYSPHSGPFRVVSSVLTVTVGASVVLLVARGQYPLEFYGLTLKGWRRSLVEGIVFTLPFLALILLVKWILIAFVSEFNDLPLTHFGSVKHTWHHWFGRKEQDFFLLNTIYILLVPFQEFIARGCLQSCFYEFFRGRNKTLLAILASNLLFALFHGLQPFTFILVAFIFGIFWGWLYSRQRSLIGPSVSHILVSIWAFGILDYDKILIY